MERGCQCGGEVKKGGTKGNNSILKFNRDRNVYCTSKRKKEGEHVNRIQLHLTHIKIYNYWRGEYESTS